MATEIIITDNQSYQKQVRHKLNEFNHDTIQTGYFSEWKPDNYGDPFGFYAMKEGKIIGGLIASKKMQWLDVTILLVEKEFRNQHIASELIERAITYCQENDLVGIHIYTLDFQAKGLYEKLGFTLIASIKDWPKDHTRYEFIKYI